VDVKFRILADTGLKPKQPEEHNVDMHTEELQSEDILLEVNWMNNTKKKKKN
jgi:hypothetical protein